MERDTVSERVEEIVRDETRRALLGDEPVVRCAKCDGELATEDAYSGQVDGRRVHFCRTCNLEDDDPRADWPVHQPGPAYEAPIPGTHWYGGCEPGYPRVDPETGICEGCGETACRECGRSNCPDHPPKEETC